MTEDRNPLRTTFDEAAPLDDEARPGYPAATYDDLQEESRLRWRISL